MASFLLLEKERIMKNNFFDFIKTLIIFLSCFSGIMYLLQLIRNFDINALSPMTICNTIVVVYWTMIWLRIAKFRIKYYITLLKTKKYSNRKFNIYTIE